MRFIYTEYRIRIRRGGCHGRCIDLFYFSCCDVFTVHESKQRIILPKIAEGMDGFELRSGAPGYRNPQCVKFCVDSNLKYDAAINCTMNSCMYSLMNYIRQQQRYSYQTYQLSDVHIHPP